MSRLYDRILAYGCEALRPDQLSTHDANATARRESVEEILDREGVKDPAERQRVTKVIHAHRGRFEPKATEVFDPTRLLDTPVINADEVARYCSTLSVSTDITDVVTTLAPPFDRFFVDIQGVRNPLRLHAWGVLVEQISGFAWDDRDDDEVGWELQLTLLIERDKGKPVGPAARYFLALDREGLWARHLDGGAVWAGSIVSFEPEAPDDVRKQSADSLVPLVLPALMAVSFMHCRNVSAAVADPPPKLSTKWRKRHGRPLVRYQTLDIAPMGAVLDRVGRPGERGLGAALHICRGHFKTFSEDAPLFGRVSGIFWWASQVRGTATRGAVVKDYRIRHDDKIGQDYRKADEAPELAVSEPHGTDPDAAGRGLGAHNRTQNLLAAAVRARGNDPRSPRAGEPNYDLAWMSGDRLVVAEIKSLTAENEERQLRLGLGQVGRFRQQLTGDAGAPQAVLAVERAPTDSSWLDLCNEWDVMLVWPEVFDTAVAAIDERN